MHKYTKAIRPKLAAVGPRTTVGRSTTADFGQTANYCLQGSCEPGLTVSTPHESSEPHIMTLCHVQSHQICAVRGTGIGVQRVLWDIDKLECHCWSVLYACKSEVGLKKLGIFWCKQLIETKCQDTISRLSRLLIHCFPRNAWRFYFFLITKRVFGVFIRMVGQA